MCGFSFQEYIIQNFDGFLFWKTLHLPPSGLMRLLHSSHIRQVAGGEAIIEQRSGMLIESNQVVREKWR
jgi:hypothetical protein